MNLKPIMMKYLVVILFVISSNLLFSQKLEVAAGINTNTYVNILSRNPVYGSGYKSGIGYAVFLSKNYRSVGKFKLRVDLFLENFKGYMDIGYGGLGRRDYFDAKVNKTVLGIGLSPINLTFVKRLKLNIGLDFTALILDQTEGEATSFGPTIYEWDLRNNFISKFIVGLRSRIAYEVIVSNSLVLIPQYKFYLGLTSEIGRGPEPPKSISHFIGIGIRKRS